MTKAERAARNAKTANKDGTMTMADDMAVDAIDKFKKLSVEDMVKEIEDRMRTQGNEGKVVFKGRAP